MSYSENFADLVLSQMESFGNITRKNMFGALGLYAGPTLFAMIADDILYFKAHGSLADKLKAIGSEPFTYHGKSGKAIAMPYWKAPEACFDDPDEMKNWCKQAVSNLAESASPKKTGPRRAVSKI